MYFINEQCLLCLQKDPSLANVSNDEDILHVLFYVFPELTFCEDEFPIFICNNCYLELQYFYLFKKTSLKNSSRFQKYISVLQSTNNGNTYCKLHVNPTSFNVVKMPSNIDEEIFENDNLVEQNSIISDNGLTTEENYVDLTDDTDDEEIIENDNMEEQFIIFDHDLTTDVNTGISNNDDTEETVYVFEREIDSDIIVNDRSVGSPAINLEDNNLVENNSTKKLTAKLNNGKFNCVCNENFFSLLELKFHFLKHSNDTCFICKEKYSQINGLKRHLDTHIILKCPTCYKKCKGQIGIKNHLKIHTQGKSVKRYLNRVVFHSLANY